MLVEINKFFGIGEHNKDKVLFFEGEPLKMSWMKERAISESHMKEIAGILATPYSATVIRTALQKIGYSELLDLLEDCHISYIAFGNWLLQSINPPAKDYNGRIIKLEHATTVLDNLLQKKNEVEVLKDIWQLDLGNSLTRTFCGQKVLGTCRPMNAREKKNTIIQEQKEKKETKEPIFDVIFLDPDEPGSTLEFEMLEKQGITSTQAYDVDPLNEKEIESGDIEVDGGDKKYEKVVSSKDGTLKQGKETELDRVFKQVFDKVEPQFTVSREVKKENMRVWYQYYISSRIYLVSLIASFLSWCKYKK